jgi:hypothetical protein
VSPLAELALRADVAFVDPKPSEIARPGISLGCAEVVAESLSGCVDAA